MDYSTIISIVVVCTFCSLTANQRLALCCRVMFGQGDLKTSENELARYRERKWTSLCFNLLTKYVGKCAFGWPSKTISAGPQKHGYVHIEMRSGPIVSSSPWRQDGDADLQVELGPGNHRCCSLTQQIHCNLYGSNQND